MKMNLHLEDSCTFGRLNNESNFQIKILVENLALLSCKVAESIVRGEITVYLMLHLGKRSKEDSK